MLAQINGEKVEADRFAWDGCHKIYMMETPADVEQFLDLGYTLFPVEELPEVWDLSCWLRFISSGDLERHYVGQGEDADIRVKPWWWDTERCPNCKDKWIEECGCWDDDEEGDG